MTTVVITVVFGRVLRVTKVVITLVFGRVLRVTTVVTTVVFGRVLRVTTVVTTVVTRVVFGRVLRVTTVVKKHLLFILMTLFLFDIICVCPLIDHGQQPMKMYTEVTLLYKI